MGNPFPGERGMTRKWGSAYGWVQSFLDLRDGHKCYFCGASDRPLIIEHLDNVESNMDPENLHWSCWSCNQRKNPRGPQDALPERESKSGTGTPTEWSSREGWTSAKMTERYRLRLYHPVTGMLKNPGTILPKKWLADMLPDELRIGKSTTYLKYIDEDIASGYLDPNEVDGVVKLERTLKAYPMWKLGMKD